MLAAAQSWFEQGMSIIPIWPMSKIPAVKSWREYQARIPSQAEIQRWFFHRLRNLAIVTGWQGLTVLDFDSISAYSWWYNWATSQPGSEAAVVAQYSLRVLTSRGVHVYIRLKPAVRCLNYAVVPEKKRVERYDPNKHRTEQLLNVKGLGGYVLAPPSIHPNRTEYRFLDATAPIVEAGDLRAVLPLAEDEPVTVRRPIVIDASDPWAVATAGGLGYQDEGPVAAIKNKLEILSFFPSARPSGVDYYMALCPFHPDHNESMWLNTESHLCCCFTCGHRPMDVINLYARLNNLTNSEAIQSLRQLYA